MVSNALRTSGRLKAISRTPGATSSVSMRLTGRHWSDPAASAALARRAITFSAVWFIPVDMGQPT